LVCVHGLMGHTHDFEPLLDQWAEDFNVLIPDYAPNSMERSYLEMIDGEEWLLYDLGGRIISKWLKQNYPGRKAYFAGISVGGKISIEIAGKYPEIFAGAVITDVGVGFLTKSELCDVLENVLPRMDLEQSWSDLRMELRNKIPDRMLRILVQSHIEYPDKSVPHARWKAEGHKFYELLKKSRMEDQWELSKNIQAPVVILKSETMSAIADDDYKKQLENSQIFSIEIPNSGHFIQITHQKEFKEHVYNALTRIEKGELPC